MTASSSGGFPRPIDAHLHGATDYTAGTALMTVFPRLAGIQGTRAARQIRTAGAIHAGYSTVTVLRFCEPAKSSDGGTPESPG